MKKIFSIFLKTFFPFCFSFFLFSSSSFAACAPPYDYSSCPEQSPDWNLDVLGYEPLSSGSYERFTWTHETDPLAPQLNTLINGNPSPEITSLNQMYYWDWETNSRGNLATRPEDLPEEFDFATLVGFQTNPGQAILVPDSGYNIGEGCEVLVIYADQNSIVLRYTRDDDLAGAGYTLYLENIRVDQALLDYYHQLSAAGRTELPALMSGMKIGEALGEEILVAIRDTGTFLDPRNTEWWQGLPGEIRALVLKALTLQKARIPPPQTCSYSNPGDRSSRPRPCDPCNKTNRITFACAESFTVSEKISLSWYEGQLCANEYWAYPHWYKTVTIDPSQTTVPFVGKKGKEDETAYLADYFEGTNEYYKNYERYWLDWVNHAGVFRKLTPMLYQDKLKKAMIKRAEETMASGGRVREGGIHNYKVNYTGRLCWDIPLPTEIFLAFAERLNLPLADGVLEAIAEKGHYCLFEGSLLKNFSVDVIEGAIKAFNSVSPFNISFRRTRSAEADLSSLRGHEPPAPGEENYINQWQAWKNSDWGKLWEAVPLFSREDTAGEIDPYLGARPKDNFSIRNLQSLIERVPHLTRLYETTQKTNKLMAPVPQNPGGGQGVLRRNIQNPPLGPTCNLTEPLPVNPCKRPSISDGRENDTLCCNSIPIYLSAVDSFNLTELYRKCEEESTEEAKMVCRQKAEDVEVSRQIGINLYHPYLSQIWHQTNNSKTLGIFNYFRPAPLPNFPKIDAASQILYSYKSGGVLKRLTGKFYFPYLGGVQLAKEWLVEALHPLGRARIEVFPESPGGFFPRPADAHEICQWDEEWGGCDYYQPGLENQYLCESNRCNPFGLPPPGKFICANPNDPNCDPSCIGQCHWEFFEENPAGGYGPCYYKNPNVCVRNDGFGGCPGVCNAACCPGE